MTPIVFVHYGNIPYLRYCLEIARYTNPDAKIILVGDDSNKHLSVSFGLDFIHMRDVDSRHIQEFRKIYEFVGSAPLKDKITFGFIRYMVIQKVMSIMGLKNFWCFDSDTLICEELSQYKPIFTSNITQMAIINLISACCCFIQDPYALYLWAELVLDRIGDEEFKNKHRTIMAEKIKIGKKHALCNMTIYEEYQKVHCKSVELSRVINDKTFDPNINLDRADQLGEQPTWEMTNGIKKITWKDNKPYCYNKMLDIPVQFITLNLSLQPIGLFRDWSERIKTC